MDSLPELVLIEIFNRLPLYNRLAIRLVCKQWRQLVDESVSCSRELVLFYMMERRPLIWHYSDQPVNLHNSIIVNFKFRTSECFKRLFHRIKRLYITSLSSDISTIRHDPSEIICSNMQEEFFDHVNCFKELEHFEVYHSKCLNANVPDRYNAPFEIDLKNLKTFYYETQNRDPLARMASCKLEQLSFFEDFHMNAKFDFFKSSLKSIKVRSFFCDAGFELPNLEVIYFSGDLQIEISAFKKLKEVHHFFFKDFMEQFNADQIRMIFNGLFEQRSRLRRKLLIYFEGNRCEPDSISTEVAFERIRGISGVFLRHVFIRKTDLQAFLQDQNDFRVEHLRKHLEYTNDLDEVITAMNDQQIEKLARSLDSVTLIDQLSPDPMLISKLRGLFRYVEHLCIYDRFPDDQLELLPEILPSLISLKGASKFTNPIYPDLFYPTQLCKPCSFISKFKGLKNASITTSTLSLCLETGVCYAFENLNAKDHKDFIKVGGQASLNDFNKILDECRFLKSFEVHAGELSVQFQNHSSEQPQRYTYSGNNRMIKLLNWESDRRFPPADLRTVTGKEQIKEFLLRYGFFEENVS